MRHHYEADRSHSILDHGFDKRQPEIGFSGSVFERLPGQELLHLLVVEESEGYRRRGRITSRLQGLTALAAGASAAVFPLMHWAYGDTLLLANTFFAGPVWAGAYLVTRNIWPIVASHAAVGTFAFWVGAA